MVVTVSSFPPHFVTFDLVECHFHEQLSGLQGFIGSENDRFIGSWHEVITSWHSTATQYMAACPHVRMSTSRGNKLAKPLGRTGRCSCFQLVPNFLAPVYPLGRGFGPRSSQNTGIAWIGWGQTPAWIFLKDLSTSTEGPLRWSFITKKWYFPTKVFLIPQKRSFVFWELLGPKPLPYYQKNFRARSLANSFSAFPALQLCGAKTGDDNLHLPTWGWVKKFLLELNNKNFTL